MDYGPVNVVLTFGACVTRRCMSVTITNDGVDELDEFFTYHLRRTTGLDPRIELYPVDGRIEILDKYSKYYNCNSPFMQQLSLSPLPVNLTVGYNSAIYTTSERQRMVVLNITIFQPPPGGSQRPFTLVVNTEDVTAGMVSNTSNHACICNAKQFQELLTMIMKL